MNVKIRKIDQTILKIGLFVTNEIFHFRITLPTVSTSTPTTNTNYKCLLVYASLMDLIRKKNENYILFHLHSNDATCKWGETKCLNAMLIAVSLLFSKCFDIFNKKKKNLNHLFVKTLLRWSSFVESEIEKKKKTPSWQWEHTPLFFLKFTFLWSNQNFSLWMRHKELLVFKFTNVWFFIFFFALFLSFIFCSLF